MQLSQDAAADTGNHSPGSAASLSDTAAQARHRDASFSVGWALTHNEVREAQRLRFDVFVNEMGAVLQSLDVAPKQHDIDPLDEFCDHLLVRAECGRDEGKVIATCRVLTPAGAVRAGHRYTDLEFDLTPIDDLLPHSLEMGRVCVHGDWRNGLLVMALWREIGVRMSLEGLDTLIGCCSVTLDADGDVARRLWHGLKADHSAPRHRQVAARHPLDVSRVDPGPPVAIPALFKGYLRCGGQLLGPPAIDPLFNTADFPMLMSLRDLPARYRTRIFGQPS